MENLVANDMFSEPSVGVPHKVELNRSRFENSSCSLVQKKSNVGMIPTRFQKYVRPTGALHTSVAWRREDVSNFRV